MVWVSGTVPGFQEALKQNRESKIRAVQRLCPGHTYQSSTSQRARTTTIVFLFFFQSSSTLTFSLCFPFHTVLATVFFEGGEKLSVLSWEKEKSCGIKDNERYKKDRKYVLYIP